MPNILIDTIKENLSTQKPLVWLDAEDFGRRVLLNGNPFPWSQPTELVNSYNQLQDLLKPDIAQVSIASFLELWLAKNSGVLVEMRGKKRIRFAVKKLLSMEEPRALIQEIVGAITETAKKPVVLVFPPNGHLINWANKMANGAAEAEIDEMDVDSTSVYLADFLRIFSELRICGVVVQLPDGTLVDDSLLELYSPIMNVAKHYHWVFGVMVKRPEAIARGERSVDLIVSDHPDSDVFMLDDDSWKVGSEVNKPKAAYFSKVPVDISPELVTEKIKALKANVG